MNYQESTWNGFRRLDFEFEGYPAILVLPKEPNAARRLAIKTEYFGAFPKTEIAMLEAGYHLCYLKNRSRWGTDDDCERKAHFIDFLADEFGTARRVVTVGMSCGGFHAVCFASRYPEYISFLYIDAPLLTFFSMAPHRRAHEAMQVRWPEVERAWGFKTYGEAYAYNDQPIHRIGALIAHKLPVGLVYGLSDEVVPSFENAEILREMYEAAGTPIKSWARPAYGHHPHGLDNPAELLAYIEEVAL